MTALALPAPSNRSLDASSLPSLADIAQTTALGTLDTAGRLVQAAEQGVDTAAQIVSATVPAVTRFVGGFVLPEHLNRILGTVVDYGAHFTSSIAAAGAKATAQTMTFGAPALVETLRQQVGVSAISGELQHNETSREFLARCFAGNTGEPLIRDGLLCYLELRKELSALQQSADLDQERARKISLDIARLEIKLRDYQDFSSLKMILEKGDEFVTEQHKRINQLARDTAERVVERVECYFQDQCGRYAGKLQGSWSAADTEEKRAQLRTELTQKIAARLQNVFDKELSREETRSQLDALAVDLHSAFGTYRSAFKASMYMVLGVGYATGALHYLANAAGCALQEAVGSTLNWICDGVSSTAHSVKDAITSSAHDVWAYCYKAASDFVTDVIKTNPVLAPLFNAAEATSHAFDKGAKIVGSTVTATQDLAESALSVASDGIDLASEKIGQLLPEASPNYASPYWNGTDRVFVGFGRDGAPIYGHSCISGFPSEPRFGGNSLHLDLLKNFPKEPASAASLLKPGEAPTLDPEQAAELLEWIRKK